MDNFRLFCQRTYTREPDTQAFRMHTHDSYEIYCFLAGDARYFVEGSIYELKPGDILLIKKAEAHSLLIHSAAPYERIVINFDPEALLGDDDGALDFLREKPLGKRNRYAFSAFREKHWLYYLNAICSAENMQEKRLYLTVLLWELRNSPPAPHENTVQENMMDILAYINNNLTQNLSLEHLCSRFFLSKSQLNRKFKRITGSTVWEYITTKRLLLAKQQLLEGALPTTVYLQCGFNDYGAFFRAYRRQFDRSPKDDCRKK